MFGLETIKSMNAAAARKARRYGTKPFRMKKPGDVVKQKTKIPFLGDACRDWDEGFERVATLFVDSSGFGSPGEPALTQDAFVQELDRLVKEHGELLVAVEEQGQFQCYVAVWVRNKARS